MAAADDDVPIPGNERQGVSEAKELLAESLRKFVKQFFCVLQIAREKPLREPTVDGDQKVVGFLALASIFPKARQTHCCTQFP
jgi:hypothetical protein